jgi:DNA gyrase/topoisomerase IV subunit B
MPPLPEPLGQIADIQTRLLKTEIQHDHFEKGTQEKLTQLEAKGKEYITRREFHQFFSRNINRIEEKLTHYMERQDEKDKEREEKAEKLRNTWTKIIVGVATTLIATGAIGGFTWLISALR